MSLMNFETGVYLKPCFQCALRAVCIMDRTIFKAAEMQVEDIFRIKKPCLCFGIYIPVCHMSDVLSNVLQLQLKSTMNCQ